MCSLKAPNFTESASKQREGKYEEFDYLNKVADFHKFFEVPILKSAEIPSAERCNLRLNLLREEIQELQTAIDAKDLVEVADALCDIQYVLSGTVLEFGLASKFSTLMSEVHSSNMSKACSTREEAEATVQHYLQKDGTEAYILENHGKFKVYRTCDNKTLKSINYQVVNIPPILDQK
eukprot:CAMPEP_0196581538 /NCGR_PEP_ID=MMETSP1081-20130531/34075_1 /TAXON_ID=36882 /ORGANISM="Pyramimonas amylifera, Strain CCMP720" /LENGTH=177 /DNA_ID=CAMNT_0041901799 /DNA_START=213 /DNA_END=746 /DNA_ORIENTATION=-